MTEPYINPLKRKLEVIRNSITETETHYNRPQNSVTLVAVSKTRSASEINAAFQAGQLHFGESYLQEALEKIDALQNNNIIWHYIGRIQSKKLKAIANNFSWVQTITDYEQVATISKYRNANLQPMNVCIQVNISNEPSKSGISTSEIIPLATQIASIQNIKLRGLMAIPKIFKKFSDQLAVFQQMHDEFTKLKNAGFDVDTLSIGMSSDYQAAIAAGSTMIRIGTALFGHRDISFAIDDDSMISAVKKDIEQAVTGRVCVLPGKELALDKIREDEDDFKKRKEEFKLTELDLINIEKVLRENTKLVKNLLSKKELQEIIIKYGAVFSRYYKQKEKNARLGPEFKENLASICILEKNLLETKALTKELTLDQIIEALKITEENQLDFKDIDNDPVKNNIIKTCVTLLGVLNVYITGCFPPIVWQNIGNYFGVAAKSNFGGNAQIDLENKINFNLGDPIGIEMAAVIRNLRGLISTDRISNLFTSILPIPLQENVTAQPPHVNARF